jgi:hypothetical protein
VVKAVEDRLDRQWLELRECLLEGGALEDQLGAMRAAFFCGAHGAVAVLAQGGDAADALLAELHRELRDSQATVRRMGLH